MSIAVLRRQAGLTQRQVAFELGVTERTYIGWEMGKVEPRARNLMNLAAFFRCDPALLLGKKKAKPEHVTRGGLCA